jgi:hypothetical protein
MLSVAQLFMNSGLQDTNFCEAYIQESCRALQQTFVVCSSESSTHRTGQAGAHVQSAFSSVSLGSSKLVAFAQIAAHKVVYLAFCSLGTWKLTPAAAMR